MRFARSMNLINMPVLPDGTLAFTFSSSTADGSWTFVFKWLAGKWNAWVTLPSGEVRQAGCVPNVVDWSTFADYGFVIVSSLTALGLNDLASAGTSMVIIAWD
jgi:hypothetical protein